MRDFIEAILIEQGYNVTTATNGKVALNRIDETVFPYYYHRP